MIDPRSRLGALVCVAALWAGTAIGQVPAPTQTIPPLVPPTPSFNGPAPRGDVRKKSAAAEAPAPAAKTKKAGKADTPAKAGATAADEKSAAPAAEPSAKGDPLVDPVVARSDAEAKLKALPVPSESQKVAVTPYQKALREVLGDRIKWIDAYEKAVKELDDAKNPKEKPEQAAAERKNELERAKALLESVESTPGKLLPELFTIKNEAVSEAKLGEMREAIDAVRAEIKEANEEIEKLRAKPGRSGNNSIVGTRAERDKTSLRVAALPARRTEREKALQDATASDAREIARERLLAFEWEAKAESERIKALEAQIRFEIKKTDLVVITLQARDLQSRVSKLKLDQMQARYRAYADSQQHSLKVAAANEANRANNSEDVLERLKAQRKAELLELEAALTSDEKAYAASPRITLQEQSQLADRAATEFADLKALLKDDKVSSLDALQLNNDFRRVSRERSLIQRNELADAAAVLAYYENQLTELELELLSDARDDRFELESLLALLPPERHAEARNLVEGLDQQHRGLLVKRRAALDKLAARAKATHTQVLRRLDTLDEEYAFVKTNLFWIRDAEPIGFTTLLHARRDLRHFVPGLVRLAAEPFDRKLWTQPSVEFVLSLGAVRILPFILIYARNTFRKLA